MVARVGRELVDVDLVLRGCVVRAFRRGVEVDAFGLHDDENDDEGDGDGGDDGDDDDEVVSTSNTSTTHFFRFTY